MNEDEKYKYYRNLYFQYVSMPKLSNRIPEPYYEIYSVALYYFDKVFRDLLIEKFENEDITSNIITEKKNDNSAYLFVHMAINQRMKKVYFEFDINNKLKEVLNLKEDEIAELEKYAMDEIMRLFRYSKHVHQYKLELITPADKLSFCCDITQVISCHTVGYWKSIYGKYSVLEDREQVKADMLVKGVGYDKTILYKKIHDINLEYNPGDENYYVIPEAFEDFRIMYLDELGIELPDIYEDYASITYANINTGE